MLQKPIVHWCLPLDVSNFRMLFYVFELELGQSKFISLAFQQCMLAVQKNKTRQHPVVHGLHIKTFPCHYYAVV
jgi:hypothetical protein